MFLANATAYIVSDDQFWTGGRLISVPQGTWAWSDGSPWAYETWADGQPTYKPSSCLLLNTELLLNHNWFSERCSNAHQYICEVPSVKQPCPLDWFRISSSSFCYKLVTSKQNWGTWTNALDVCRNNYRGDLASIPSSQVNHEIRMQVLKVSGDTEFWIGAHRLNQTSDFVWSDGSPLIYTNWDDGQPQFTYGETMVYMDESGYWSSSDGDAAARSFLCVKHFAQ